MENLREALAMLNELLHTTASRVQFGGVETPEDMRNGEKTPIKWYKWLIRKVKLNDMN